MAKERSDIKQQIVQLSKEREAYLAERHKTATQNAPADTFGDAFGAVVQEQLEASGFELEK